MGSARLVNLRSWNLGQLIAIPFPLGTDMKQERMSLNAIVLAWQIANGDDTRNRSRFLPLS